MEDKKIRALLLDLDGTLLINDMQEFMPRYRRLLLDRVGDILPTGTFLEALDSGIRALMRNDGRKDTNEDVFKKAFFARVEHPPEQVMPLFDTFYREDFEELRDCTQPDPLAREMVALAKDQGYKLAIATQPVFPLEAILARLRWAEVPAKEFDYDFVACYESMRACKPHPVYFEQILTHLGCRPQEALMVGDSVDADLGAARIQIKTFWMRRGEAKLDRGVVCDAQGDMEDLIALIETGAIDEL